MYAQGASGAQAASSASAAAILHFIVVTSVGDTVVFESTLSNLREEQQLDIEFFLHASLDTLDLLCREKPDCFFPLFEIDGANNRSVSAYCPVGPYRLLLLVEPQSCLRRGDMLSFFMSCSRVLSDALRNPMASIQGKLHSQQVRDLLRHHLERLGRGM